LQSVHSATLHGCDALGVAVGQVALIAAGIL
jgi:hypothetical protein